MPFLYRLAGRQGASGGKFLKKPWRSGELRVYKTFQPQAICHGGETVLNLFWPVIPRVDTGIIGGAVYWNPIRLFYSLLVFGC